jgi:hypothetical protein
MDVSPMLRPVEDVIFASTDHGLDWLGRSVAVADVGYKDQILPPLPIKTRTYDRNLQAGFAGL